MDMKLGRIQSVKLGNGGYDDAMFGVSFSLGGEAWGVQDFWGTWAHPPRAGAEWTEADQKESFVATFFRLKELMRAAKVDDFTKLAGVPVEVKWNGNRLESWRILTEVL